MGQLLWGKVYYQDTYAGILREEPGGRFVFEYDSGYQGPAIAYTLPKQSAPHISEAGLPPFFDNLVAEGWLEGAQARLLGKKSPQRFELLLAFGYDCAGAVSVIDPTPARLAEKALDLSDPKEAAVLRGRASLSGVQAKLALIQEEKIIRPAQAHELSTHIGKFASPRFPDIAENEYLTTLAFKTLLPDEDVADLQIQELAGLGAGLVIRRFDRGAEGQRVHFEEFNQLLGYPSHAKYDGDYREMADFIQTSRSLPTDSFKLLRRILAGLLLGNTDMHLKNFAMFHTPQGLRLAPVYDQVCGEIYDYHDVALKILGAVQRIGELKARHIEGLSQQYLPSPPAALRMVLEELEKNLPAAKEAIHEAAHGTPQLKDKLINQMEKRWNGTFRLIGPRLLKKR